LLPGDLPPPAVLQEAIMALVEVAQSIEMDTSNTGEDRLRQSAAAMRAADKRPCSPRTTGRPESLGAPYVSSRRAAGTVSLGQTRARLGSPGCHIDRCTKTSAAWCNGTVNWHSSLAAGRCSISIERGQTRRVDRHGFTWRGLSEEPAETSTSKRLQYDDRLAQSRRFFSRVASPQKHARRVSDRERGFYLSRPAQTPLP
jgi:hypothetical protein